MFRPAFLALALLAACAHGGSPEPRLSRADLARVAGAGWAGTLVYRDYSPPFGDVTLDVEADVAITAEGLSLSIRYPKEPQANSVDTLVLSADGTRLGGDPIVDRREAAGVVIAVTKGPCEDDGRPADCERVYRFGDTELSVEKSVRFRGEAASILRNAYRLKR